MDEGLLQPTQVSQLRLEAEKLRCAAAEAQGGLRQRTRAREVATR